jgi:hypothetical protein
VELKKKEKKRKESFIKIQTYAYISKQKKERKEMSFLPLSFKSTSVDVRL